MGREACVETGGMRVGVEVVEESEDGATLERSGVVAGEVRVGKRQWNQSKATMPVRTVEGMERWLISM